jgi:hypothetical protein
MTVGVWSAGKMGSIGIADELFSIERVSLSGMFFVIIPNKLNWFRLFPHSIGPVGIFYGLGTLRKMDPEY